MVDIPPGVHDGVTMQVQGEGNFDKERQVSDFLTPTGNKSYTCDINYALEKTEIMVPDLTHLMGSCWAEILQYHFY